MRKIDRKNRYILQYTENSTNIFIYATTLHVPKYVDDI